MDVIKLLEEQMGSELNDVQIQMILDQYSNSENSSQGKHSL